MRPPRVTALARPRKTPDRSPKMVKGTFKVIGSRAVYGTAPGELVELHLTEDALNHLIEAGHLAPAEAPSPGGRPTDETEGA